MKNLISGFLPFLALALLSSACGNLGGALVQTAPSPTSSLYSVNNTTLDLTADTGSNSNYTCPAAANVKPDYDYWHDGSDTYTVCTGVANSANVEVHGKTHSSNTICAFPAQVINGNVYSKPDLANAGLPLMQCLSIASGPADFSFPSTNYNALFIVESGDEDAMQTCLVGGNYLACPHYSYGQFAN